MLSWTASMLPEPSLPFYQGVQLALAIYGLLILYHRQQREFKVKLTPLTTRLLENVQFIILIIIKVKAKPT